MNNGLFWRIICRNPGISHPQWGVRDPKLGLRNNCWHPAEIPEDFTIHKAATRLINSSARVSYRSKQFKTNISPFISYALFYLFFFSCCEKMAENKWRNKNLLSIDWKYFFFRSTAFLSQLSVHTAKGSNGSCLYKRQGAQINRRENWVYLEPLAKTKLSTMWNKTGPSAELQSPCTILMISKLCVTALQLFCL